MGALDFLKEVEGRVLDAATYQSLQRNYELQEENNRQLKEKVERLECDKAALKDQVDRLSRENAEHEMKITSMNEELKFVTHEGFAFKRRQEGGFETTGYCPNCKVVMSNPSLRTYQCPKCKYFIKCKIIPDALARQLNA